VTSPQRSATTWTSLKWFLWHGNVFRALQTIEDLECQLDEGGEETTFEQARLAKAVGEFDTYIRANADRIPTTGNATASGRPSPAPSSSPPSTRSSANAW